MNIKLTQIERDGGEVLINWNNVHYVKPAANYFGEPYTEIHCGKRTVCVKESIDEIEIIYEKRNNNTKTQ